MSKAPGLYLRGGEVQLDPYMTAVVQQHRVEVVLQQPQRVGELVQSADQGAASQGRANHQGVAAAAQLAREQREAFVVESGDELAQQGGVLVGGNVVFGIQRHLRVDAGCLEKTFYLDTAFAGRGEQAGDEHGAEDDGGWIRHWWILQGNCGVATLAVLGTSITLSPQSHTLSQLNPGKMP
ncbi:hypothetical protein D3C76_949520 [compost metagenome]